MANLLDDPAFWLPTQILDDNLPAAMDLKPNPNKTTAGFGFDAAEAAKAMFPLEFPYVGGGVYGGGAFGASSDLSSPVESVVGSSETESDEEDYLAELNRQMACSTLDSQKKNPKGWGLLGSPQSTLCAVGSTGCGGQGSSRGSPNSQSPAAVAETWDLLHAAAGEVAKMRVSQSGGRLGPPTNPSPSNNNADVAGLYLLLHHHHQQSLSHKHLQAAQFQRLRQQQMMEQSSGVWGGAQFQYPPHQQTQTHSMVQSRVRSNTVNALNNRPLGLSPSAWPPLQQAAQQQQYKKKGSGLRAVTLGNPNPSSAKRESAGTGVFLPRQIGARQSETRKKPGCSTVLVPARVVQALGWNIDHLCSQQQQPQFQRGNGNGRFNPDYDVALRLRSQNNGGLSQQKRNIRPQQQPQVNNEIRLPQEWTY